jgi:hypothetical protein
MTSSSVPADRTRFATLVAASPAEARLFPA